MAWARAGGEEVSRCSGAMCRVRIWGLPLGRLRRRSVIAFRMESVEPSGRLKKVGREQVSS
jgi:hypothetical protein